MSKSTMGGKTSMATIKKIAAGKVETSKKSK